ncbi:MAG: GNAT family N-acetyltransferase [Herpetosiphon sp.]
MNEITFKVVETPAERDGHFAVRHAVFVDEQQLFAQSEVDEYDDHAILMVAVDTQTDAVVGAVRCIAFGDDIWYGGRLAVLRAYRRHTAAIGANLCRLAENIVIEHGCRQFLAYIQLQNVRFFEQLGWTAINEPLLHYGEPHQIMAASLAAATYPIDRSLVIRELVHA